MLLAHETKAPVTLDQWRTPNFLTGRVITQRKEGGGGEVLRLKRASVTNMFGHAVVF